MPGAAESILEAVGGASQVDDGILSTPSLEGDGGKHESTTELASGVMLSEDVSSHDKHPTPPMEMFDRSKGGATEHRGNIEQQESQQPGDAVAGQMNDDHAKPALYDVSEVTEEQNFADVDGEVEDDEQGSQYLEVVSIASPDTANADMQEDSFIVEEVQTEGRMTEVRFPSGTLYYLNTYLRHIRSRLSVK